MKWKLFFICFVLSLKGMAQNPITASIAMPQTLPANTADWASVMPPIMIQANIKPDSNRQVPPYIEDAKVLVTIKSGGSKICGSFTNVTAPQAGITSLVKIYRGADIARLLGQNCVLNPGSYNLCVQFFTRYNGYAKALSEEVCKQFSVKEETSGTGSNTEKYTPPVNISPADGKVLSEMEQKQPITFRWAPVVPKPQGDVLYKLRVFEVRKGQSAREAIKAGTFLAEKEALNQTQYCCLNFNLGSGYSIAKDSKYGWYVEAMDKQGKSLGSSEVTVFSVSQSDCNVRMKIDSIGCTDKKDQFGNHVYKLKISLTNTGSNTLQLNNAINLGNNPYAIASIFTPKYIINSNVASFVTPATFPSTVPLGLTTFYTEVSSATTNPKINFRLTLYDNISIASCNPTDSIIKPICRCETCDQVQWQLPGSIKYDTSILKGTNNILSLYGTVGFGPQKIVKLSTEIVDFYWYTEGDCKKTNSNDYYFGNLVSGSAAGLTATSVADETGVPLISSHQLDFVSPTLTGITLNTPVQLNISLPPQTQLSCCTDCFRFCIRYTATFMENGVCKTCSILKCYESKRKHRQTAWQLATNQCGDPIIFNTIGDLQQK